MVRVQIGDTLGAFDWTGKHTQHYHILLKARAFNQIPPFISCAVARFILVDRGHYWWSQCSYKGKKQQQLYKPTSLTSCKGTEKRNGLLSLGLHWTAVAVYSDSSNKPMGCWTQPCTEEISSRPATGGFVVNIRRGSIFYWWAAGVNPYGSGHEFIIQYNEFTNATKQRCGVVKVS